MSRRIGNFIYKTLNTRITPLAYLFAATGLVWGVAFTYFQDAPGVRNTILFKYDALVGVNVWGIWMCAASIFLLVGMFVKNHIYVQIGASGGFMGWLFAAILYLREGYYWLLTPLAILNVLMYGYYYLSAALGTLWDYSPWPEHEQENS